MAGAVKKYFKSIDFTYYLICMALSGLSLVTLASVAQYAGLSLGGTLGNWRPFFTQVMAAGIGLFAMALFSVIDYRRLAECGWLHAGCWALVLLTFVPGVGYAPAGTGSQSWIALPFGMSFQPTEIAKISFCLTFAAHLARVREKLNHPGTLVWVLLHLGLPVLLVHLQGDDGTATVFLAMGAIMLVAAGLNRWVVAGTAAALAALAPVIWNWLLGPYQRSRILGLFNPQPDADGIMYQQLQGRQAIASGGVFGIGFFGGQHHYVPRAENDFIFSYYAESGGFLGALVLLLLLFGLMGKTLRTAAKAMDFTGSYLCVGMFAVLFYQSVINLGMNLMLVPVVGITLPFMSAGGTSVLMLYICMGLVLSVERVRKTAILGESVGLPSSF